MERAGRVWGWTAPVERPQQREGRKTIADGPCRWHDCNMKKQRRQERPERPDRDGRTQRWKDWRKGLQVQPRGECERMAPKVEDRKRSLLFLFDAQTRPSCRGNRNLGTLQVVQW